MKLPGAPIVLSLLTSPACAQLPPSMVPKAAIVETARPSESPPSTIIANGGATGTFQVRGIGFGKLTARNWETSWGSYDRSYERQQHIEVILSSWGRGRTEAELQCLWIGRELKKNGERVILNWSSQAVTLVSGTLPKRYLCHSGVVEGSAQRYNALNEFYADGHKIEGWYVRLKGTDGKLLHDAGSATYLVTLGRDYQALGKLKDLTPRR